MVAVHDAGMAHADLRAAVPDAIIIQADHFHFSPAESRRSNAVQSRRLFWCRSGRGVVTVNGGRNAMAAGSFLFMPWGHDVRYEAARRSAFDVGSIHLIPSHARNQPPAFGEIPHVIGAWPLAGRTDAAIPGLAGVRSGDFAAHRPLGLLAEYVVATFRRVPDEAEQRALAVQVLVEVQAALGAQSPERSPPLAAAIARLERAGPPPSLGELAGIMQMSPSSAIRAFKRETGATPRRFLIESRIRRARDLLLGTDRPIHEIGETLGMPQHYFSRLFRQIAGVSPRQCRAERRFV